MSVFTKPAKQKHILPLTAYDFAIRRSPEFLQDVRRKIETFETQDDFAIPIAERKYAPVGGMLGRWMIGTAKALLNREGSRMSERDVAMMLEHDEQQAQGFMVEAYLEHWRLLNMVAFGNQTFYVHENAVPLLATTTINVDADLFRLPAPACMFVFDGKVAKTVAYQDNPHAALAAEPGAISVFMTREPSFVPGAIADIQISAMHETTRGPIASWMKRITLQPGMTVEECLNFDAANLLPAELRAAADNLPELSEGGDHHTDFLGKDIDFIRLAVNAALYATSKGADLSAPVIAPTPDAYATLPKGQQRRMEQARQHRSSLSYIYIGQNLEPVEFDRDEVDRHHQGGKLTKRFRVRAHQRWQRVGTGRSEIKLTDVKSYVKGPEAAEMLHRRTVMKLHPDAERGIAVDADDDIEEAPTPRFGM